MLVSVPVATRLTDIDPRSLGHAMSALDGLEEVCRALQGQPVWLVGGAVRDLLLGATRADLDLVTEADASEIASLLGHVEGTHARFGTATARVRGVRVDVARARRETYSRPGALPDVEPATLAEDLARRDFSVNAMALPLVKAPELVDPHGGLADLAQGVLRVLHTESFRDDPTRALRAARYAARLGLELEPQTRALVETADLGTVSGERTAAELRRTIADPMAPEALELLFEWGLAGVDAGAGDRLRALRELLEDPDWADTAAGTDALFAAALPGEEAMNGASGLAEARPRSPSHGVALLAGVDPAAVLLARAQGTGWLDDWARKWRKVTLAIGGRELMDAGVSEGPAVGRGLDAALAAKLDGEISSPEEELRVAREAAT